MVVANQELFCMWMMRSASLPCECCQALRNRSFSKLGLSHKGNIWVQVQTVRVNQLYIMVLFWLAKIPVIPMLSE